MNRIYFFLPDFKCPQLCLIFLIMSINLRRITQGISFKKMPKNAKQSWNKTNKVLNNKNLTIGKKSFDNILISGNGRIITDSKIVAA